jgi:hypothetical protein
MANLPGGDIGGGSSGTGGGTSTGSGASSQPAAAQRAKSSAPVQHQFQLLIPTPAAPIAAPYFPVEHGDIVEVRAINTNTKNIQMSITSLQAAQFGPYTLIGAADNPVQVSVANLADIRIYDSVAGEGVLITVRRPG